MYVVALIFGYPQPDIDFPYIGTHIWLGLWYISCVGLLFSDVRHAQSLKTTNIEFFFNPAQLSSDDSYPIYAKPAKYPLL